MRVRGFAPTAPCWVELAHDPDGSAPSFYAALFGWSRAGEAFLLGDRVVAGARAGAGGWRAYLAVDDLDAALARTVAAGGRVLAGPVGGGGTRDAVVADPQGAVLGLRQGPGVQLAAEPGAMSWPELHTADPAAAAAFHAAAFDWLLRDEPGGAGRRGEWLTAARDAVAGLVPVPPGGGPAGWRVAFQVADCGVTAAACRALGGRVLSGPAEVGLGCSAELADPDGARFVVAAPLRHPRAVDLAVVPAQPGPVRTAAFAPAPAPLPEHVAALLPPEVAARLGGVGDARQPVGMTTPLPG